MENTIMYRRYKECPYKFKSSEKVYTYEELKEYFFIDGSEVVCCTRDFGECKSGKYYLLIVGGDTGNIYIINDLEAYVTWFGKEYMKENVKVSLSLSTEEISILSDILSDCIEHTKHISEYIVDIERVKALINKYEKLNKKLCDAALRME